MKAIWHLFQSPKQDRTTEGQTHVEPPSLAPPQPPPPIYEEYPPADFEWAFASDEEGQRLQSLWVEVQESDDPTPNCAQFFPFAEALSKAHKENVGLLDSRNTPASHRLPVVLEGGMGRIVVPDTCGEALGYPTAVIHGLARALMGEAACRCGAGVGDFSEGCPTHGLKDILWAVVEAGLGRVTSGTEPADSAGALPMSPEDSPVPASLSKENAASAVDGLPIQGGDIDAGSRGRVESRESVPAAGVGGAVESLESRRASVLGVLNALSSLVLKPHDQAEMGRNGRGGGGLPVALASLLEALCHRLLDVLQNRFSSLETPGAGHCPNPDEDCEVCFLHSCMSALAKIATRSSPWAPHWYAHLNATSCPREMGLTAFPWSIHHAGIVEEPGNHQALLHGKSLGVKALSPDRLPALSPAGEGVPSDRDQGQESLRRVDGGLGEGIDRHVCGCSGADRTLATGKDEEDCFAVAAKISDKDEWSAQLVSAGMVNVLVGALQQALDGGELLEAAERDAEARTRAGAGARWGGVDIFEHDTDEDEEDDKEEKERVADDEVVPDNTAGVWEKTQVTMGVRWPCLKCVLEEWQIEVLVATGALVAAHPQSSCQQFHTSGGLIQLKRAVSIQQPHHCHCLPSPRHSCRHHRRMACGRKGSRTGQVMCRGGGCRGVMQEHRSLVALRVLEVCLRVMDSPLARPAFVDDAAQVLEASASMAMAAASLRPSPGQLVAGDGDDFAGTEVTEGEVGLTCPAGEVEAPSFCIRSRGWESVWKEGGTAGEEGAGTARDEGPVSTSWWETLSKLPPYQLCRLLSSRPPLQRACRDGEHAENPVVLAEQGTSVEKEAEEKPP
ncbi:unnamed protein product, partial [Discosporangium mesarthrocarpum]